jgi:hypothetical protein
VVCGDEFVTRKDLPGCTAATLAGEKAHSLVGEPGEDLNYNETVVFDEAAALPSFLIVYTVRS